MSHKRHVRCAVAAVLLLACAWTAFSQEKVTISWWGDVSPQWVATYRAYEKLNPNVTIKEAQLSQEWASTAEKFLAAVAAGIAPDSSAQNSHEFPHFASQGVFLDLTPYVKRDGLKASDWFTPQWNGGQFRGRQFGLPGITDARILYYNRKLFREAGLDPDKPPTTAKELEAYTAKLTKKDASGRIVQFGFIPTIEVGMPGTGNAFMWVWLNSSGGQNLNADGTQYTVNNPKFVQALEWVVNFYDKYCGGAETAAAFFQSAAQGTQNPFNTQRLAMKVDNNSPFKDIASLPDLDAGYAPNPVPDVPGAVRTTYSCGSMFALSANTKHPEEAWRWISWISQTEGAKVFAANYYEVRKRTWASQGLPGEPYFTPNLFNCKPAVQALNEIYLSMLPKKEQAGFKTVTDSLEYTRSCAGLGGTGSGLTGLAFYNIMSDAFQQAVYHKKSAQAALNDANTQLNKGLAEAWQQVKIK
jgi:ABC-type glycerol-3-phosphate transport system substrate-binding protein